MKRKPKIEARWDDEAKVWYVYKSDIPGLCTEAATKRELVKNVRALAKDLIELNQVRDVVPLELVWIKQQSEELAV